MRRLLILCLLLQAPVILVAVEPVDLLRGAEWETEGGAHIPLQRDREADGWARGLRWLWRGAEVRAHRLDYRLSPPGAGEVAVLERATLQSGPPGEEQSRLRIDTRDCRYEAFAFRGLLQPSRVELQRQEPDPTQPERLIFQATMHDLDRFDGLLRLADGRWVPVRATVGRVVVDLAASWTGGVLGDPVLVGVLLLPPEGGDRVAFELDDVASGSPAGSAEGFELVCDETGAMVAVRPGRGFHNRLRDPAAAQGADGR